MRHRKVNKKLKREKAPRVALYRSLARSFLLEESMQTTLAKAKALRPFVEKLITLGKRKNQHAQRLLIQRVRDQAVVDKLTSALAERFADREGGYTRIRKVGFRAGDGAPMAQITLVANKKTAR